MWNKHINKYINKLSLRWTGNGSSDGDSVTITYNHHHHHHHYIHYYYYHHNHHHHHYYYYYYYYYKVGQDFQQNTSIMVRTRL